MNCSNAIILAAGRGSRMRHHTKDQPKCLVPLYGRPLIDWQISALKSADIDKIGVVTGYQRSQVAKKGTHEFHNNEWATTNMVTSLLCADSWLSEHPCIISYSDIFYQPEAITQLMVATSDIAITYDPNWLSLWSERFDDPLEDAETFKISENGHVKEIGNPPKHVNEIEGQYMGLIYMTPKGWSNFKDHYNNLAKEQQRKAHMTGMLQSIVKHNLTPVQAIAYTGLWGEMDSDTDYTYYHSLPYEKPLKACL